MVMGFALLVAGGLLLEAGISGRSLADVVRGLATANHRLKLKLPNATPIGSGEGPSLTGDDFVDSILGATGGVKGKSPKGVIDSIVLPICRKHGINLSPAAVAAANARHGPTSTGGVSDHQGPPEERWAVDIGTAHAGAGAVDKAMKEIAQVFGFTSYKGLISTTIDGLRIQLIWQAPDHYDHGHVGVQVVGPRGKAGKSTLEKLTEKFAPL